jgi:hypothetical protein
MLAKADPCRPTMAEGLPAANCASILLRGRTGIDPDLLSTVDAAVRDVLAAES